MEVILNARDDLSKPEDHLNWMAHVLLRAKANAVGDEWKNVCRIEEELRKIILSATDLALPESDDIWRLF